MLPDNLKKFSKRIPVLDHGYIMLVDIMGDDEAVVQAARVSYAEETQKIRNTEGLIRYLLSHKHTSPFEQARIKLEVKLPIFVERQWVRHRMASLNEVSARYSVLPEEFYSPDQNNVREQSKKNKQGVGDILSDEVSSEYLQTLQQTNTEAYAGYRKALEAGISREQARLMLPVNTYTAKVWTQDLHNLMHFLKVRMDSHAQWEIQQYAKAIAKILKEWVPITWTAFEDYELQALKFSRMELLGLAKLLKGASLEEGILASGLAGREAEEFKQKIYRAEV
jgi:thymidylate synthase (FAD)